MIRRGVSGDWDESVESTFRVVVSVLLRRPCDADRLPVVVRLPAGPQVSLKCGDLSKDNGAGHKKLSFQCHSI